MRIRALLHFTLTGLLLTGCQDQIHPNAPKAFQGVYTCELPELVAANFKATPGQLLVTMSNEIPAHVTEVHPGQKLTLELRPEGNALLTHDFQKGKTPTIEFGRWNLEHGQISITFLVFPHFHEQETEVGGTMTFTIRDEGRTLWSTGSDKWIFKKERVKARAS